MEMPSRIKQLQGLSKKQRAYLDLLKEYGCGVTEGEELDFISTHREGIS